MTRRPFGQVCGLARALELVGERWALLIVRDLLLGPKRFTDLKGGLPGVPSNILTTRLRELEMSGVVQRRVLRPPAGSTVYELTAYGRQLEDVVLRLGLWGAGSMPDPQPGDVVTADMAVLGLRAAFRPEAARARRLRAVFEVRVADLRIQARVAGARLDCAEGGSGVPDLVLEPGPHLGALLGGALPPEQALTQGLVTVHGDGDLLSAFVDVFHVPPVPVAEPT